jgi:hypothetical protein
LQAGLGLVQLPALPQGVEPRGVEQRQRRVKARAGVQADLSLGQRLGDPALGIEELRALGAQQLHLRQVAELAGPRERGLHERQGHLLAFGVLQQPQPPTERGLQ